MARRWTGIVATAAIGAIVIAAGCTRQPAAEELVARADEFFAEKRYNDAYTLYKAVAERDPKNLHALVRLAECSLWLQDADRGLQWAERALKVDPYSALAWEKKGELLLAKRQAAEAAKCFKKALQYDGALNVARLNLSLAYEMMGDTKRAIEAAREAVAFEPKSAEGHFRLGGALQAGGRPNEAEAEYRRAIALDANHAAARVRLARLLVAQRRKLLEARKFAQEADRIRPGNGEAAVLAAWALYVSGDKKAALRELEQVARAHPTNFEAWALLARGLRETGRKEAARRAAQIAMQLAPRRGRPPGTGRGPAGR